MIAKDKKFLFFVVYSIILVFTVCISYTFISSYIKEKQEFELFKQTWQYRADTNFTQSIEIDEETGEQTVVYEISTPEQLAGMSIHSKNVKADSNQKVKYQLKQSLDLSGYNWTSSGSFSGTYNGDGFVISGLSSPLYDTISSGAWIECVTIDCSISSFGSYLGAVARQMEGGTIIGVNVSGSITCTSVSSYAGGIVGKMSNGTIKHCINRASITDGFYSGGIAGYVSGGQISNCFNYGNVKVDCTVKLDNSSPSPSSYVCDVGGIAGYCGGSSISCCKNEGDVSCEITQKNVYRKFEHDTSINVGGIVGFASVSIDKCANYGDVEGGNSYNKTTYAGGIAGYASKKVSNCYNSGTISANAKLTTGENKTEVYPISKSSEVKIYNINDLSIVGGKSYKTIGGGSFNEYGATDFASYTSETGYFAYRGGIVGCASASSVQISGCFNQGIVEKDNSEIKKVAELSFKRESFSKSDLWIQQNFSYGMCFTYGAICGNSAYISGSYNSNSSSAESSTLTTLSLTQTLNAHGQHEGKNGIIRCLNGFKSSGDSNEWYLDYCPCGKRNYATSHMIDASSISKIVFSAKYWAGSKTTYYTYYTGISKTEWTSPSNGISGNIPTSGSSIWNSDYTLKALYW